MTGSSAAIESSEVKRAILEGLRALVAEVTDCSLMWEARGRLLEDDDEAEETESERVELTLGRLGVLLGLRGPAV